MTEKTKPTKRAPRKKKTAEPSKTAAFLKGCGAASAKMGSGFAMGAAVGAVKEGYGEEAAGYMKAGLALGGLVAEVILDPVENPIASPIGKSAMYGTAFSYGEKVGEAGLRKAGDIRHDRAVAALRRDMQSDDETSRPVEIEERDEEVVPVPKKRLSRPESMNGTQTTEER